MSNSIFKKNSNEFSFADEVLNEVNNTEFKNGIADFENVKNNGLSCSTTKSYIWSVLSGVGNEIEEDLYQNVLNYIDNVSDIDTCNIKALQSMIDMLGTNYSILANADAIPIELLDVMNIFSIRSDYLLNNEKLSKQTINFLSNYTGLITTDDDIPNNVFSALTSINVYKEKIQDNSLISSRHTLNNKILDNIISSTYYTILSNNIYATYNDLSSTRIYKDLSNYIILSGFELPNAYSSQIEHYKIRYNIDASFNVSEEVDNLENDISQLNSYSQVQQGILSIEIARRNEAKDKLDNRTRYYYYNQVKVREYFKFVEDEYNNRLNNYISCNTYDIDTTYLEISSVNVAKTLMDMHGSIDDSMIVNVAKILLDITKNIRQSREYLKSHAQRTYMKGTFLLIQYAINEYLKNNIYKSIQALTKKDQEIPFNTHDNEITLTEYIDQTQYFNIESDNDTTMDVNPKFWINAGTDANDNVLDNTNIFRVQDKSKLVTGKVFSLAQIADFYTNILNNKKIYSNDNNQQHNINENVKNFLTSVFEVGADSTYLDKNGRVMCELQYGKYTHTQQIEDFIDRVQQLTVDNMFILSDYQHVDNMTLCSQFNIAEHMFKQSLLSANTATLAEKTQMLEQHNNDIQTEINDVTNIYQQFQNINLQYNNFIIANSPYTGNYVETTSNYLLDKIANYTTSVLYFDYTIPAVKSQIKIGIDNIHNSLVNLFDNLKQNFQNTAISSNYELTVVKRRDEIKNLDIKFQSTYKLISEYINNNINFDSIKHFEDLYDSGSEILTNIYSANKINTVKLTSDIQVDTNQHIQLATYDIYEQLKDEMTDYLNSNIDIMNLIIELRQILDYQNTEHYKNKAKLYYKYIGLDIGELPYYNLTNQTHPSYQIHPCLQNFIEYTDYSYPIDQLAGIAKENIEYVVQYNLNKMLDADGYLSAIWRNPLNGNSDYLTKYEKSNHIDTTNNECKTYGWDGLFYPEAVTDLQTNYSLVTEKWLKPMNLAADDIAKEERKALEYKNKIISLLNSDIDIYRYGLDIYGNSYILVKSYNATDTEQTKLITPGTLWIKYKNYPFAYPAMAFSTNVGTSYFEEYSQFNNILSASNTKFAQLTMAALQTESKTIYVPQFTDFTISKDRNSILLAGTLRTDNKQDSNLENYNNSTLIFADISQQQVKKLSNNSNNQLYLTYVRSLNQNFLLRINPSFESEYIPHPGINIWQFKQFYYKDNYIGGLYTKYTSPDKLDIAIKLYNYNNNEYMNETISTDNNSIVQLKTQSNNSYSIDSTTDGDITVAQIYSTSTTDISTYLEKNTNYRNLTAYIDVFNDKAIWTQDLHVIENKIFKAEARSYQPFSEMGFIPLLTGNNDIRNTHLLNDFEEDGLLKFQLIGASENKANGVDFKFTAPIRMYQNYTASQTTDQSYHRNNSGNCKIYDFANVHYTESKYNQYMTKTNTDAVFYDKDEIERINYLSIDPASFSELTNYYDYVKLANHDVTRYLQLMRSELKDEDIDNYIVKPYLIYANNENDIPFQYVNGYLKNSTITNVNQGNFSFTMFDNCYPISVSWIINNIGSIKLDFNSRYYTSTFKNNKNIRNKWHLFLNLDKPGEAGYLNCYNKDMSGNEDASIDLRYTFFIKNISYDNIPKFIMTRVNKPEREYVGTVVGAYEYDLFKENNSAIIGLDGFETKYIDFQ